MNDTVDQKIRNRVSQSLFLAVMLIVPSIALGQSPAQEHVAAFKQSIANNKVELL